MQSLQAYLLRLRLPRISRGAVQLAAALFGAAVAYRAFVHFDPRQSRAPNFDETIGLLGIALLALAVVAWDGARPQPATWPSKLADFLRRHWWEMALLLPIVGFAAFMFTFRFGEFPPSDFICCEENGRARVAYDVIHGDRPLEYFTARWPIALGFLIFGENALGLRMIPVIVPGVLTVPVFYLLVRQLVKAPAALFGTALLASLWPLTRVQGPMTVLVTVLFAFLLVLGIRKRNAFALLGAGFLAGELCYEWGPYQIPPIAAGAFFAALAVYKLAFPLPASARAVLARARSLVSTHWRSTVVFVGAALIVVTPLLAAAVAGESTYFGRVEETARVRERSGVGGFIVANWQEQFETTVQMFTHLGIEDTRFGARLVDPLTGGLVALGVIMAAVTFFRPYRLFFLAWYLSVIVGGALLLNELTPWRFFPALPAAMVLVAFAVDDVGRLAGRWLRGQGLNVIALLLVGGAIYAAYWNATTLFGPVQETFAHKYEEGESHTYALCNYLRGRDEQSPAYTFNETAPTLGFAVPHETVDEQRRAWRDLIWACQDLRGTALASPAEAWPVREAQPGPRAWVLIIDSAQTEQLVASLRQVIPGEEPDRIIRGPAGFYDLVAYELSGEDLEAQQGLFGEYRSTETGAILTERVDDVSEMEWDAQAGLSPPFAVQWRGLIYLPQASSAALVADTSDPVRILVDGQVTYSSLGEEETGSFPRDLLMGWHPVEILLLKETPGGSFGLQWVGPEGTTSSVARQDLFALATLEGWLHEREVDLSSPLGRTTTQRFNFAPHFSSAAVIQSELRRLGGTEAAVLGERWSAVWRVPQSGEYRLKLQVRSGTATVIVDGATVLDIQASKNEHRTEEAMVSVSSGEHRVEVRQIHDGGAWTGARLTILAPENPNYVPEFSPY